MIGIVSATAACLLSREVGIWAGAAAAGLAVLYTVHRGRVGPWLLAFPAALASVSPPPSTEPWPRSGPVLVKGVVLAGIRRDPPEQTTLFRVGRGTATVLCVVNGVPPLLPGDRIQAVGRIGDQPERRRLGLSPRVQLAPDALEISPGAPSLVRVSTWCRHRLQDSVLDLYQGREALLLASLVLGRGLTLPEELANAHRATGLSHLLAVSGAHASILAWALALLWSLGSGRNPLSSNLFRRSCVAFLLLYGAITGLEPPVFRALAAWLLALTATARGRRIPLAAALGVPALLTVLVAPAAVMDVSFALSYAAVFGLSLGAGPSVGGFWRRWVLRPMVASFWATVATAPITAWVFGQVAPWTIFATPLLAPLVVIMLAGGLVSATVGCLAPGPAAFLAAPVQACTWLYCRVVEILAELPGAPIFASTRQGPWEIAAAAGCGVLLLVWLRNRWGVLGVSLMLVVPHLLPALEPGPAQLQLLSVGHGQACLARLANGTQVLIDCGSLGNPVRAARQVVAALGRRRQLDLLVVTHGDADHTGGIAELLRRLPVHRAVLPLDLAGGDVAIRLAAAGTTVLLQEPGELSTPLAGVRIHAPALSGASSNDRSLWVELGLPGFTALVSGDAEEAGTRAWLAGSGTRADVLVLPHHGRHNVLALPLRRKH